MTFFLTALIQGLCLSAMGLGIYITMKIFKIPDITTDGSYTLGAAVTAVMLVQGWPLPFVLLAAMMAGVLAGIATGLVHTRLGIDPLLAGILVMTGLYSVNLSVLGRSNIPLIEVQGLFSMIAVFPTRLPNELLIGVISMVVLSGILAFVLRTDFGIAMRATGDSETMSRALGIDTNRMKVIGLALANLLTALSGFLVTQYQKFADINMGLGIVLVGLGSVLIGDAIIKGLRIRRIWLRLLAILGGCILFQSMLAAALSIGINPNFLKLMTALFVMGIVGIPRLLKVRSL
ncbi:MAG: ABC transporter permease [Saprospiraceae bacterium]|jgi:putative ABC transport system permease protein